MTGTPLPRRRSDPLSEKLRNVRVPMLGRTYRYRYGYPWRWAIPAEVMWRIEHGPAFRGWGYRWRKHFEHKGAAEKGHQC